MRGTPNCKFIKIKGKGVDQLKKERKQVKKIINILMYS